METERRSFGGSEGNRAATRKLFDEESLSILYNRISAAAGVTIAELKTLISEMDAGSISQADLNAYRQGRPPWKKMHDEVVPVMHFLLGRYPGDARVRFPLNDQPPDAWLTIDHQTSVGIEVTGALSRSRVEVSKNMAAKGIVPGFIGLQDNASIAEFEAAKQRGRVVHSAVAVNDALEAGIRRQLKAKNQTKYKGYILLVTANLHSSPGRTEADWNARLVDQAAGLPFSQVFLVDGTSGKRVFQLK